MNITGSRQENVSAIVPENITGSGKAPDEVKKKSVYVAETGSLVFVSEDYTPAQQTAAARREEFEQINEFLSKESFWNRYVAAPTATFVKSAANQASDLSIGSLSRLEAWAENAGAEIAYDKARQQGMDYPQALLQLRKETIERNRRLADKAKFDIAEGESEVAQNLGSGAVSIGSMFLAWGLGNKKLALDLAKTFGLSSGTSMYENLTMAGVPFDTATYRGAAAGVSEYALEKIGFEWVTNRIVNERLYPITKRFIEPMAAGSVQETAQEGKDILLEQGYVESTPDENFDRLATAAIYGAILETAGANVGYELRRRGLRKNLEQAAIKDGYDTKTAAKLAKAATPSTNEMLNILRQQETQMLDGMEKFTPEQMAEYEKSIELARNLPTEDAAAEVQFYDGVKSVILKSGIDENEARRQASYWSLMVKNDYELAKENGAYQGNMAEFQRDWLNLNIANRANVRAVKIGNRVVETPAAMTEEEINEAWQERNAERQMTAEERYREESQRGVLFSKSREEIAEEEIQQKVFAKSVPALIREADKKIPDAKVKAGFGTAKGWLVTISKRLGMDIEGYKHIVDARSIKHIFNRHGKGNELADNQIPVTDKDIENIPNIVNSPDYLVYGTKTDTGRDGVGYLKTISDGTTYYVEEIRDKEKQLAAKTMYKIEGVSSDNLVKAIGEPTSETTPSAVRLIDKLKKSTVVPAFTQNIASGNIKVNNKLFSKENYQLPQEASDAQGKADINTPEFKKRFGNSKVVDENGKPYSNKQLEKLLNNPQGNKEAILDVYENHLKKYNNNLASMVRTIAMIDLGAGYKPTSGEAYNLKIEMKERELSNLKLPKKITLNYLTNILKKNNISVTNTYTANTGSQYITMDLEGTPYENAFADSLVTLSIREHRKHSADYIRPDIDFWVDYDNQWQESLVELADKLDLKGGEITKAKKYVELSKSVYNRGMFDPRNDNIYLSNNGETVRGTYDPSERLIELFADAKPDTLTHELSHHFFQNHFRVAQEYGFSDYDRGVMKWLSKRGKHDITGFADMQDQDWENLTEAFIRYLNTDTAPTIATRGLFQKAKEWVLGVYDDNRDYASNEVKDFFDALVSREGTIPNLDNIIKNKADFEESIKQALRGESATFRGMNRGELRKLRQATHTRVRRPGRTLEQELRALGYRVDAVNRTLADEKGVVDDARLAEILQEIGVLDNVDTETYEQTDALSAKMQDILANAATTYSPREAKIQQEREASIRNQAEAQRFIDELLQNNQLGIKTIEELDELLAKVVSKPDDVDIVKVNRNAIKYLQAKTAEMNKDYREAIRQIRQEEKVRRETQYQLQNRMKNFIRSLPVTGDHKASLMGNIQRVKDAESFEAVLNDVRRRAAGYIEQEQKQLNRRNIEETIKSTKPTKFRKQRYTYEDNKFFAELRDILKMSRTEALRAQEEFAKQIGLDRADGDVPLGINISEYDRLKNLLYYYKINGAESSLAALQDLATSLEELKAAAADKRLDEDTLKSEVRKKDKDELLEGINKYKASNIFVRGMAKIGTIRSAMSEYFGKEMADKWNLEPAFERVNIFMRSRIKPVMDSAREIYGAAKASDFLNLMQNKSQKEFELTDNDGDYDKLSIMDIADIYIGMKDPNTRANYYAAYEKFDDTMPTDRGQLRAAIETMSDEQLREHMLTNNLGTLLSYLSEQDMRFADMVQEEVGSMWELENEIFVKLYGIDLPQNRNYFPRTSKNAQDYDVMENLRVRGQTPGFFKERASTVTPRPKNIWTKYQEYVTSVGYVQNVALKYKDLHSLMTDKAIRGAIVKKYGEDSYRAFMANLDDLSIKGAVKTYNEVGRTMQKLLNNLVSGTVALNVPMAFKQLPAALNYSVNMPKTEFIKNFLYAATHPAEVKRVMDSYVGDFLKTRYEQGSQSDAIGRAMAEADSLVNSKFGLAGFSHNWRQLATTPIRFADIFAIYWGGYAKLKYNIDRGLAPEKIREDFIDETLSNQAAGNPATLAKFQREQSLRFFTAFRNVPAQYMRLITTTMTQWRRGEISDARFFSNIGNYVFVQPALYIWLGWLVKSFLYGDDDDEWFDGMMTEMALSPIAGLPIIADLASFGLDKAESALTGKSPEPWDALQVFGVDTLNKLMWKLVKDDKTGWDWAEIAASVIDVGTGAGLGTAVRTVKKLSD